MVTVNAIFAGFTGVLIAHYAFDVPPHPYASDTARTLCFVASAFAFWLFACAAEKITDALDEGKVRVYFWSMFMYNLGVVLALLSVTLYLSALYGWSCQWLLPLVISFYPWLKDIGWILYNQIFNRTVINDYINKELMANADT
jgi:hypothetical protein